ncbi:MAG: FAD-binding protein [Planctomycetota bacterium]|nr:FAD-binding protein [Planctomycetota bacterium]
MIHPELLHELRLLLSPGGVVSDAGELLVYESDGFTIAKSRPGAVVFPKSTEDVAGVVGILGKYDVQIVPRGSGTGLAGGCVAFNEGIIVSTARMNRILRIDLENRVACVQAGVRNTQLSEAVSALPGGAGFHFAPDPSSQRASTIGGNAATNAGGIHTLKDFVSSNHVLGIEMVLADGEVLTTGGQNGCCDAGPFDLPGLICGSEGTLGIITSLWVRLAPKPSAFRTIVATFRESRDATAVVTEVISAGHLPSAMEMLDGRMVQVVEQAFSLGLPADAQALILTEIDGIEELLDAEMREIVAIHEKHHAISIQTSGDPTERARLWKARKATFGAIGRISHSYCTQDACVPRSKLVEVMEGIDQIGREHGLQITNVFHAGDGNVHPIFLYDERDEAQVQAILRAAEKVLQFCVDVGGTITGEHGVGVEKIHLMPYLFDGATLGAFSLIKKAFDPGERINAGKMIASDKVKVRLLKAMRQVPQ